MKAFLLAARAVPVEGYFRDIGTPEAHRYAVERLRDGNVDAIGPVVRDIWS
jgi:NDP-sugar pyrophosphorylase family protein